MADSELRYREGYPARLRRLFDERPYASRFLLPIAALWLAFSITSVKAQSSGELQILMPSVIQIETATESPFPIRVSPPAIVPKRSMALIRGLPSTVALSEGRLFESGIWGVPVADLDQLKIASPTNAAGRTDFSVSVVTFAGDVLAQANSSLLIVSRQAGLAAPQAAPEAAAPPKPEEITTAYAAPTSPQETRPGQDAPAALIEEKPTPPQPPTGEALERIMLFMRKGEESMKVGNVHVARLFFTHAANEGWADGALALAATYDPDELASLPVMGGIQPDPELAKKWYQKAAELGSEVAGARIQRLSQR